MQRSIKKCALAGCAAILVSGCATQQNAGPEFRLSSSAPAAVPGASMLQRGRAQLDAGLNALAIEAFRAEIRTNPDAADAYNGLAVAYGRIGRSDLAQRYFETALAKDPGNVKVQANLARLTGDTAPAMQMVQTADPAIAAVPVAMTPMRPQDPTGQLIASIEQPDLVSAGASLARNEPSLSADHVLAQRGVLSTRFAVAPASFVSVAKLVDVARHSGPGKPAKLPQSPKPTLPSGYLTADYRATGARLLRVSLGEVHLITLPQASKAIAVSKSEFKSFGDRLAIWLPQSIAIEQAPSGSLAEEGAVLLAAVERAEQRQHFLPVVASFELGYLSFEIAEVEADA